MQIKVRANRCDFAGEILSRKFVGSCKNSLRAVKHEGEKISGSSCKSHSFAPHKGWAVERENFSVNSRKWKPVSDFRQGLDAEC